MAKHFVSTAITGRKVVGIVVREANGEEVMLTAPPHLTGLLLAFDNKQSAAAWSPGAGVMELESGAAAPAKKLVVN